MPVELENLQTAARDFEREVDEDLVDPAALAAVIDLLQAKLAKVLHRGRQRGDWQLARLSPAAWAARTCGMSRSAAGDRLCVGKQLDHLPDVAAAVRTGEVSYQKAAALCHLREQLGDRWPDGLESDMVGHARHLSVENFRIACRHARHEIDPDGFDKACHEDFERRWLEINTLLDGMYSVDGILDPATGAAFKTALDALATSRGAEDTRNHGQRMADSLAELLDHHMNEGRLPRKNGVRPHVTLTTTLQCLKNEVGQPAAELAPGALISNQTVERLTCDCAMSRVLLADSMVIDVGRATRIIQPATRRALEKRDRGCRWPGCDRPVSWSTPHHIEFWSRGGRTNLSNLVLLCHFHHRLVHEGEWHVIKAGQEVRFIPPERLRSMFARGPDVGWAA